MLHLGSSSPVDVAMNRFTGLATSVGATPRHMARAIWDTLDDWRGLPEGRQYAMQLRALLAAELAGAIEKVDTFRLAEQQQAQAAVDVLRAGVEALGERLARW